jgi:hypothetical protein
VTGRWERVLDDCEARLDAASAVLSSGSTPNIAPFAAPTAPEPLPGSLVQRARALVARGEDLEHLLTTESERIRTELRRLPRMPRAQSAAHLDVKA